MTAPTDFHRRARKRTIVQFDVMDNTHKKQRFRIKLFNRSASIRLAILLGTLISWAYFTMIQMPSASFRGQLPSLTQKVMLLRDALQRDAIELASEIGQRNYLYPERLVRDVVASFCHHTQFPSEGAALPEKIAGVGWSDQWSFWQQGYPGVMVTDTALLELPYYHTQEDTPDKVDYDRLARVVAGLERVIGNLSGLSKPQSIGEWR